MRERDNKAVGSRPWTSTRKPMCLFRRLAHFPRGTAIALRQGEHPLATLICPSRQQSTWHAVGLSLPPQASWIAGGVEC